MSTMRAVNPPCEKCGQETLHHSNDKGSWNECPDCGHRQQLLKSTMARYRVKNSSSRLIRLLELDAPDVIVVNELLMMEDRIAGLLEEFDKELVASLREDRQKN